MACKYPKCDEPVNSPHDEEHCLFHAPVEKKGVNLADFNYRIFERINNIRQGNHGKDKSARQVFNSRGFIFLGDIDFNDFEEKYKKILGFNSSAFFDDADFHGNVNFSEITFENDVSFNNAKFYKIADFSNAKIDGKAVFINAHFYGRSSFQETRFLDDVVFTKAEFNHTIFIFAEFNKIVYFIENTIHADLDFAKVRLGGNAEFYLQSPYFQINEGSPRPIIINFDRVQFFPFHSFFQNIRSPKVNNKSANIKDGIFDMPLIKFRFCSLKDIYFIQDDMFLFSFHSSYFDVAMFISCNWGQMKTRMTRRNIIFEENFINYINCYKPSVELKSKLIRFQLGNITYDDVAALYRRMKTALDRTKDYQEASWFYFNEFEMKRKAMEEEIENSKPKWKILRWQPCIWLNQQRKKAFSRYCLYFAYKVFAGYGEKPLWSFWWFWFSTVVFSFIHLFTGLFKQTRIPQEFHYSLFELFSNFITAQFWKDFLESFIYAISRVLPISYVSTSPSECAPFTTLGNIASVFNTIILIILIIFIGIGLKRHFRRF